MWGYEHMWVLSFFENEGGPVTGLSPLIKIIDIATDIAVIDNSLMNEVGDGFYKYYFEDYDQNSDYAIICDSVTLSGSSRYSYASSGEYNNTLSSIESSVSMIDLRTVLLRKLQTNKLELLDGDTDNWILYDDDGVTPLLVFSVSDKLGDYILQPAHIPSRRSKAAGTYI